MSNFNLLNGIVFYNGVNVALASKCDEPMPAEATFLAGFDFMSELHVDVPIPTPAQKLIPDSDVGTALCRFVKAAKSDHRLRGVHVKLFERALKPGYICDDKVEITLGIFATEDNLEIIDLVKNSLDEAGFSGFLTIKNPYPCLSRSMRKAGIKSHVLRLAPKRASRSVYRIRSVSRSAEAPPPRLARVSLRGLFQELDD